MAHSDFWAQCFPLLAIIAPLAVLARPTIALLRRWRLAGKRHATFGDDRAETIAGRAGVTGAVMLATALAAGSFTLAQLLTDSTSVLLSEKAAIYLGSDLQMTTRDVTTLPAPFDTTGTIVYRTQGRSGTQSVDLLGVDSTTFVRAVHWRDDASDHSLGQLVESLGSVDTTIAGPARRSSSAARCPRHTSREPHPIDRWTSIRWPAPRWFPGFHNGAVSGRRRQGRVGRRRLCHHRGDLAARPTDRCRDAVVATPGIVVRSPRDLSQVFNVTSFVTVRWAYATLSILGVLVGIVVLLAQLLVLDARARPARPLTC